MERFYETEDLESAIFGPGEISGPDAMDAPDAAEAPEDLAEEADLPSLELELTLEDGRRLACQAVGVFLAGEKQYIALRPKEDTEGLIHILELAQGEDDQAKLLPVEDDRELEEAARAFYHMIGDEGREGEWIEEPADEKPAGTDEENTGKDGMEDDRD